MNIPEKDWKVGDVVLDAWGKKHWIVAIERKAEGNIPGRYKLDVDGEHFLHNAPGYLYYRPDQNPHQTDRRHIDWKLGWIDRRRRELEAELADLERQECEVLGLKPPNDTPGQSAGK